MKLREIPISPAAATKAMEQVKQLTNRMKMVGAHVHMLRCQLIVARAGIVANDQKMIVEALNEMDDLINELHRGLQS